MPKTYNGQPITLYDQLNVLFYSIRRNWKSDYNLVFLHSLPLTSRYKKLLKEYRVQIEERACPDGDPLGAGHNRITAYQGGFGGSHSLVLDYDIVCLREPELDYSKDMQGMYAGKTYGYKWRDLFAECGMTLDESKYDIRMCCPFNEYHLYDRTDIVPFFNNGVIFIRNSFAKKIFPDILKFNHALKSSLKWFRIQGAITLAVIKNTENWGMLPKGCNFLSNTMRLRDWNGEVSLYHYLAEDSLEKEVYDEYFDHLVKKI
jgi:hypothetical protein